MATIEKRKSSQGEISYRVKIRLRGFPPESATFERLTDARRWAEQTQSEMREGRHFRRRNPQKHTLAELVDRYIRDVLPGKPNSQKKRTAQLEWWKAELGHYRLADVDSAMIVECRDKLARGVTYRGGQRSPATVRRYMAALSHVFSLATGEWKWLEDSPMRGVGKPPEPRGRVRFLSDDERARLLEACKESRNPFLYPVTVLALSTCMRRGEILGLRWGNVDLQRGRIALFETKNRERRSVSLAGHALELMKGLSKVRRIDTDLVFPGSDGTRPATLREAWEQAVKRAQLSDFRFHDLRHSGASYLAMNGATLAEIAEVLGHKTLSMVKRYAHFTEGHTSKVVASMNEKIFGGSA